MAEKDEKYYVIADRTSQIGWTLVERLEKGRKEIFYHTSKDVIETAFSDIKKGKFDAKKYSKVLEPKIMIVKFDEKHGELIYAYTSREEFYNIFLEVLTSRYEQKWYSYKLTKPKKDIDMSLDEIQALKDEKLKASALQRFNSFEKEMREYNEHMQLINDTDKAYKEKNARLAYDVLSERKDGEYEGFEIIKPERVGE